MTSAGSQFYEGLYFSLWALTSLNLTTWGSKLVISPPYWTYSASIVSKIAIGEISFKLLFALSKKNSPPCIRTGTIPLMSNQSHLFYLKSLVSLSLNTASRVSWSMTPSSTSSWHCFIESLKVMFSKAQSSASLVNTLSSIANLTSLTVSFS